MLIKKSYEIERVCEPVKTPKGCYARPVLQAVHVENNGHGPVAVACDGHALACVPVADLDKGIDCLVPGPTVKLARKVTGTKLGDEALIRLGDGRAELLDGSSVLQTTGTYPNWTQLIPSREEGAFVVAFNAKLLAELAAAMGTEIVQLTINTRVHPFIVEPIDPNQRKDDPLRRKPLAVGDKPVAPFGVLMPCEVAK